jgi:hypothetical protein
MSIIDFTAQEITGTNMDNHPSLKLGWCQASYFDYRLLVLFLYEFPKKNSHIFCEQGQISTAILTCCSPKAMEIGYTDEGDDGVELTLLEYGIESSFFAYR